MSAVNLIYIFLLSLNLITLVYKWKNNELTIPFNILLWLIGLIIIVEICTSIISRHVSNNLIIYHIFNPVEFILYSLLFSKILKSAGIKRLIYSILAIYLALAFLLSIFVQKVDVNNSYAIIIESICIIIYALMYLRQLNIYEVDHKAENNPYFWVILGILLYFTGSLFVEGYLNLLISIGNDVAKKYYKFSFIFKYLMCMMFLTGVLIKKNQPNNV